VERDPDELVLGVALGRGDGPDPLDPLLIRGLELGVEQGSLHAPRGAGRNFRIDWRGSIPHRGEILVPEVEGHDLVRPEVLNLMPVPVGEPGLISDYYHIWTYVL